MFYLCHHASMSLQSDFSWSSTTIFFCFSCVKDQQNGCSRVHCRSWQAPCFPGKNLTSISGHSLETIITQDCLVFSSFLELSKVYLYSLANPLLLLLWMFDRLVISEKLTTNGFTNLLWPRKALGFSRATFGR